MSYDQKQLGEQRGRKRQRLSPTPECRHNYTPLSMYLSRVQHCSSLSAERIVSLHDANPSHITTLQLMKSHLQLHGQDCQQTMSNQSTAVIDRNVYQFFKDNYSIIRELLITYYTCIFDSDYESSVDNALPDSSATNSEKHNLKQFHAFNASTGVDYDLFLKQISLYKKFCEVDKAQEVIHMCKQMETAVDCEISSILSSRSVSDDSEIVIPTDSTIVSCLTNDLLRIEILLKLRSTLNKITGT